MSNSFFPKKGESGQMKKCFFFMSFMSIAHGFFEIYHYAESGAIKISAETIVGKAFAAILLVFGISPVAWIFFSLICGIILLIIALRLP